MVRLLLLDCVGFVVKDNTKTKGCNLRLEQEFYLKVHRRIQLTFLVANSVMEIVGEIQFSLIYIFMAKK